MALFWWIANHKTHNKKAQRKAKPPCGAHQQQQLQQQ
jgi:hypothetical protein